MKPFLTGRAQVSSGSLQPLSGGIGDASARVSPHKHALAGEGAASPPGPSVECIKQGDKVVRMIVTCTCGERIEIECLYPAGG